MAYETTDRLNNLKSLLPDEELEKQIKRELPLQVTKGNIVYPKAQLFDKTGSIPHDFHHPFAYKENQPYDPNFIQPAQRHACYRARIAKCFNRVNPYYRHYMPNTAKPWMFDTDFQLFTYWIDKYDVNYKVWKEHGGPFPMDMLPESRVPPSKRVLPRDKLTEYTNPLTVEFDSMNPVPGRRSGPTPKRDFMPYEHRDYRYDHSSLNSSNLV